jgi:hypothetical protein
VLLAFLAVFTVVDRMSATDAGRRTGAAPPGPAAQRPASGVTVQVLNGVWVTGLAHRVAGQVRAAGYDVVAAKTALGSYSFSRVYYTDGHRADAEAFKDRFPAFAVVEPAPANLSRRVALHAVIGKDYPGV